MEHSKRQLTIREAYVQASSFLEQRHIHEAAVCAELLLCDLLSYSRSELYLNWHGLFPQECYAEWLERVERKSKGEPVQYIIGEHWFYNLTFSVSPAVLIPRPETELLVENIIEAGSCIFGSDQVAVADIGTGSGAIAITLAVHRPDWHIYAVDLSAEALAVARHNAHRHGVFDRITFLQSDLLQSLIENNIQLDILVSNPPYIRSDELDTLQVEVKDYEPRLALDGGIDGLRPYRRMVQQMELLPIQPQMIGFEVGHSQAEEVRQMLLACGYEQTVFVPDLAGIDRHVLAFHKNPK